MALWSGGRPVAVMAAEEVYRYDREEFARRVYGTVDPSHPGVARVAAMGELLLGVKISLVNPTPTPFTHYKLSPLETRLLFEEKGWRTVVAFHTRNAPHIGYEYTRHHTP